MGAITGLVSGENFTGNLLIIGVFLAGAVIGILGFSKFLHWLLARWNKETLIVLAGFIIGSLVKVWPWNETAVMSADGLHIGGAVIFALIGFSLVTGVEIVGKMMKKAK